MNRLPLTASEKVYTQKIYLVSLEIYIAEKKNILT